MAVRLYPFLAPEHPVLPEYLIQSLRKLSIARVPHTVPEHPVLPQIPNTVSEHTVLPDT